MKHSLSKVATIYILWLTLLAGSLTAVAQAAEQRCGWLQNPTPGNWWLDDSGGSWVLSTQGGQTELEGMDLIPDLSQAEFVRTNGSYGYACACLNGEFEPIGRRVTRILSARQLPLSRCRADKTLPRP